MSSSSNRTDDLNYASVDNLGNFQDSVHEPVIVYSAASVTVKVRDHIAVLTNASAMAVTLPTPSAGVHDGIKITFVSSTAVAHVITAAAGKINNTNATVTFTAAQGNSVSLVAYNGIWYPYALKTAVIA